MITIDLLGISKEDLRKILEFEGYSGIAYLDSVNVWTIGYGTTKNIKKGMTCTLLLAELWMLEDLLKCALLIDNLKLTINKNLRIALIDFVYNLGIGNLLKSTLLKKIKAKASIVEILNEFRRWCHAGGKTLKGLVIRREWEALKYAKL